MALINITPTMTSNTTPSPYVASASSENSTYYAYKAFNGTNTNFQDAWLATSTTGYLIFDFGASMKISAFEIHSRIDVDLTYSTSAPRAFELYGSNTSPNTGFELLYTATNEIMWDSKVGESRLFNLPSSYSFRYYKLVITQNNGHATACGIGLLTFYQDDGVTPTEDSKTVSRRYTLPFGTKLRLDNLTSDLTYMLATESDGDNEGTLRMIDHAGKFILPKAGQKMDLIFNGIAGTVGNFLLSENITKYSSIRIVADLYGATSNRNSQAQDRTVSDILGKTGNDIVFSSSPDSSIYRYITVNFINENSFNVAEIRKANGNPCIEKIYGIY